MYLTSRPAAHLGEIAAKELLQAIRTPSLSEPVFLKLEDWGAESCLNFPGLPP